eukprot:14545618-Alexandrium_andersonii.AAC.1
MSQTPQTPEQATQSHVKILAMVSRESRRMRMPSPESAARERAARAAIDVPCILRRPNGPQGGN